MNMYSYI